MLAELIRRVTKQHHLVSTILAGLVFIQTSLTYVHVYAWSEPCLLFWILTNLLFLSSLHDSKAPSFIQIALIILASFSFYTRFAGIIVAAVNCARGCKLICVSSGGLLTSYLRNRHVRHTNGSYQTSSIGQRTG